MNEIGNDGNDVDDVRTIFDEGEFGRRDQQSTDEFEGEPGDTDRFDDEEQPEEFRFRARTGERLKRAAGVDRMVRRSRAFVPDGRQSFNDERGDRHGDHHDGNDRHDARDIRRFRTLEHFPDHSLQIVNRTLDGNFLHVTFLFSVAFENFVA